MGSSFNTQKWAAPSNTRQLAGMLVVRGAGNSCRPKSPCVARPERFFVNLVAASRHGVSAHACIAASDGVKYSARGA